MKNWIIACVLLALAGTALIHTGCETESVANNALTITPGSVGLYKNEYQDFTASGGYEYTWSLSSESYGVLSERSGPTVRYTSRYDPGSNAVAVQTITVRSTIIGATTSSYEATAEAYVEHFSTVVPPEDPPAEDLYISPSSATVGVWDSQEFTASGGSGSYFWAVEQDGYGRLTSIYGEKTTYTSIYDPGTNTTVLQILVLTDSDGRRATANITQTQ